MSKPDVMKTTALPTAKDIIDYMESLQNDKQRQLLMGFFKTGPGEYGEGDEFLGLKVPQTREVWTADTCSTIRKDRDKTTHI